jgi:hypothetical protein
MEEYEESLSVSIPSQDLVMIHIGSPRFRCLCDRDVCEDHRKVHLCEGDSG